jgi:hypothetical protein
VLPNDCEVVIVENTNYFQKTPKRQEDIDLSNLAELFRVISLDSNSGSSNKGIGELEMLNEASLKIDFSAYKKIIYFTGRQIHTTPFALNKIIDSGKDLVVSNPKFRFLDGHKEYPGSKFQYNDMCFGGTSRAILDYRNYYLTNKDLMSSQGLSSEELLYKFIEQSNFIVEKLPYLGILRNQSDSSRKIETWHII